MIKHAELRSWCSQYLSEVVGRHTSELAGVTSEHASAQLSIPPCST